MPLNREKDPTSNSDLDPLELTKQLIKLDSRNPPGNTSKVAEFLEKVFASYPTKVLEKEEGKPNLIVEISRGKPELMLTSHMDTVPSKDSMLNPVVVDGKLYGRGACDAKGCIASVMHAVSAVEVECGLKLAFTSDEEVGGVNGLGFVFEKVRSDYVIISEPYGSDRIGVIQGAVVSADITIRGKMGHTATLDAREGAVYRACEYIRKVMDEFAKLNPDISEFEEKFRKIGLELEFRGVKQAVFNPAIIKGGVKRNVIAPECLIQCDIRFAPWVPQDEIRKALGEAEFKINGVLKPYGIFFDEVEVQRDMEILEILIEAIKAKSMHPKGVCSIGVGDTRHVRRHGIPAFYYGPKGNGLHGEDEYVLIGELYKSSEVLRAVIEKFNERFGGRG
jgi:succinyl-diaminopimelate desuccinylase